MKFQSLCLWSSWESLYFSSFPYMGSRAFIWYLLHAVAQPMNKWLGNSKVDTTLSLEVVLVIVSTRCVDHSILGKDFEFNICYCHFKYLKLPNPILCVWCMFSQFSLMHPSKYTGKRKKHLQQAVATVENGENQVKTYMDNSNGVRNPSSNAYNKVCNSYLISWVYFSVLFFSKFVFIFL